MAKSQTSGATQALQASLLGIPIGSISATAERAGLSVTQVLRLRRGEQLNVRTTTLVALAKAMGKSTDELVGLAQTNPSAARALSDAKSSTPADPLLEAAAAAEKAQHELDNLCTHLAEVPSSKSSAFQETTGNTYTDQLERALETYRRKQEELDRLIEGRRKRLTPGQLKALDKKIEAMKRVRRPRKS